jgi:aspartyl-tRNA(Asn)/glutamyl-tRNA(Gln) amidotransferase subunit A
MTEGAFSFRPDDRYHAFITSCTEARYGSGRLCGIPVAVKDNISTEGIMTTCASNILLGYVPPYNAHVVDRLRAEGAAIVGKTNMDEFGMGTTTENSAFGPTLNPSDISRVPGGSSGGSAAAVASGMVRMALGTDTGGSIRCPAAFCGIVGLKPTYGRVSRYGLIAYANSLEQIGPMATNVGDTNLLMSVIAGHDPRDSTSQDRPYNHIPDPDIHGLRVGVPEEFFGSGVDPRVASVVWDAISQIERLGAEIVTCRMPSMAAALAAYYVTCTSEASSNLARFDGVRYGPSADPNSGTKPSRNVGGRALGKKSGAVSCSGHSPSHQDTTENTMTRPRPPARTSDPISRDSSATWTFWPARPCPPSPSSLGKRPIRCPCISPIS